MNSLEDVLTVVKGLLDKTVPFIIGLAVFVVLWGIFGYITHGAEEEKRAEAGKFILWGIIGIFIMLSIWGLVNILGNTFTFGDKDAPTAMPALPTIPPPPK